MIERGRRRGTSVPLFQPKPDAWGTALQAKLAALPPDAQASLGALLALAAKGGASAKPAKGWLKSAEQAVDRPDRVPLGEHLLDLIECHEPGSGIALENQETIRALIWLAAMAAPDVAARRLEAFAQKCLTFSAAHFAYLSLVLGNASIHAFVLMPGRAGVASLSRLRRRLKRPGEIKAVDKALAALAAARGMTRGRARGDRPAGLWLCLRRQRSKPPSVRPPPCSRSPTQHAGDDLARGRRLAAQRTTRRRQVEPRRCAEAASRRAQRRSTRRSRRNARGSSGSISMSAIGRSSAGRTRYLDEPLVARMARRLIWSFWLGDRWVAGLPRTDGVLDAGGTRLELDGAGVRVKLWHPMQSEASHVLAWRHRLAELAVTQPFKQAHREIYVLTDAERATDTYSNRFAGHIVQQHQFRALCQARGWSCPAFGSWDPAGQTAEQTPAGQGAAGGVLGRADRKLAG